MSFLRTLVESYFVFPDPYEDQFEKREKATKEGVAKNEYQRLKNVAKGVKGGKVKGQLPYLVVSLPART